ncbi:MAG: glycosyltransferase family 39 protein [Nitrospirota bacterium]
MTAQDKYSRYTIWCILMYALIITGWHLTYGSVSYMEAMNIFTGRQVLSGNFGFEPLMNLGSSLIQPPLAAIGDAAGGLYGARAVSMLFGIALTWIIYLTAGILFTEKKGRLSALLFLFTGTAVFVSVSATGDIIAAFFLGISFYLILLSEKKQSAILLLAGASALFLASVTKYIAVIYLLSFLVFVFWRFPLLRALVFFFLPLAALLSLYGTLVLYPAMESVIRSYLTTYQQIPFPVPDAAGWNLQWVEMPYLLAIFGMFHKEKGKDAIMLTIFSTPIFLLYFLNGTEQSIDKNMIFSLVFLIHAAALGVDHMGSLFSSNVPASWVKPFFTTAVLIVIWVFGIKQIAWFEQQYANLTPVITFLQQKGHNGMTVVLDSSARYQDYVYRYSLEKQFPSARFIPAPFNDNDKRDEVLAAAQPDFVIFNEFYVGTYFWKVPIYYYDKGFALVNEFRLPFWTGIQNVNILRGGNA